MRSRSQTEGSSPGSMEGDDSALDFTDQLSNLLESEEYIQKDYKYMQLAIEKQYEVEYLIIIKHQSHGFLNYMVTKILKVKGVQFAAYKITTLEDPRIIVHLDGTKDIKAVIKESIKHMRIELKGIGNAIESVTF